MQRIRAIFLALWVFFALFSAVDVWCGESLNRCLCLVWLTCRTASTNWVVYTILSLIYNVQLLLTLISTCILPFFPDEKTLCVDTMASIKKSSFKKAVSSWKFLCIPKLISVQLYFRLEWLLWLFVPSYRVLKEWRVMLGLRIFPIKFFARVSRKDLNSPLW